jgi:hypothetical protein
MLERELAELQVAWPETPDIASAVGARLAAPAPQRRWLLRRLPAWQVAIAAVAVVIAVVMAVPSTRAAVLDWLGLRSVKIEHREPRPSTFGSSLQLGTPVTLAQAQRRFPARLPAALGRPDAVYLSENPTRVDLVYRNGKRVGVLVTELRATATPVIEKSIGTASKFERFRVDGDPAYFISGAQHGFAYIPAGTQEPQFEHERLAGNTLLVERADGLLLRVEGRLNRDAAVRIARSVG